MKTLRINKGFTFSTLEGKASALSFNGSIVYCDSFLWNEETDESDIYDGELAYTLSEIAHNIKDYGDGNSYNVVWGED